MQEYPIDINCDMGESYGDVIIGQDEKLMPLITSCNIACGYHGGDSFHMRKTILLALKHNVRIGAHPSYPDLEGFGRRKMNFSKEKLISIIGEQMVTLKEMVEELGGKLSYVKPHGALYNKASEDVVESEAVIDAIQSIDGKLKLMGLASSVIEDVAKKKDIDFIAEAFCDRKYEKDGKLMSRGRPEAVLRNREEAVAQVKSIVFDKKVKINATQSIEINANSICVHGDNPMALEFLIAIKAMFTNRHNEH